MNESTDDPNGPQNAANEGDDGWHQAVARDMGARWDK